MKTAAIFCATLALSGCATQQQCKEPPIVEIPVSVGCLGDTPDRPVNQFGSGDYAGEKAAAQAALADKYAWEKYATKLESAMAGCDKISSSASAATKQGKPENPSGSTSKQ